MNRTGAFEASDLSLILSESTSIRGEIENTARLERAGHVPLEVQVLSNVQRYSLREE